MTKIGVIPEDEGTTTLFETVLILQGIDTVHQVWVWSEIKGESLVFRAADVQEFGDDTLLTMLEASHLNTSGGQATVSRSSPELTFVNFNFEEY